MFELDTDFNIEINNEQDAETLLCVFRDMDKVLSSLERRRHSNNFAKKIERYEVKINEGIEEMNKLNLPKEDYIEGVKMLADYYMLIGRITPLSSIGLAERELNLLVSYINGAKKVWTVYKNYLIKKYCDNIVISE